MDNVKPQGSFYAWIRVVWLRNVVPGALLASIVSVFAAHGFAGRVLVFAVVLLAVVALMVLALIAKSRTDFGSVRAVQLASSTEVARRVRALKRELARETASAGGTLRRISKTSSSHGKELVRATIEGDRRQFDKIYLEEGFGADAERRADLLMIGDCLVSSIAGRRLLRRPPPDLREADILELIYGRHAGFADLVFEPLARQVIHAAATPADPAAIPRDEILLASEMGSTTVFVVGVTVFLMDIEASRASWESVYDFQVRSYRRSFGVKVRPIPA